jgi:predicted RNA-binding protein with RPS1 domain
MRGNLPMETERLPDSMIEAGKLKPVTVIGITKAGVIVQVDGTNYTAFIHISKIAKGFVDEVSNYLSKGDRLEAMGTTKGFKPELTLVHLNLKPKNKPLERKPKSDDVPKKFIPEQHTPKSLDDMIADANRHFKDKTADREKRNRNKRRNRNKNF